MVYLCNRVDCDEFSFRIISSCKNSNSPCWEFDHELCWWNVREGWWWVGMGAEKEQLRTSSEHTRQNQNQSEMSLLLYSWSRCTYWPLFWLQSKFATHLVTDVSKKVTTQTPSPKLDIPIRRHFGWSHDSSLNHSLQVLRTNHTPISQWWWPMLVIEIQGKISPFAMMDVRNRNVRPWRVTFVNKMYLCIISVPNL